MTTKLIISEEHEMFERKLDMATKAGWKVMPESFRIWQTNHSLAPIRFHVLIQK